MELHVSLVGRNDLAGEIYRQIRGAIVDGRLQPGDPLPPSRELAHSLSVSRTTVTVAYDRLNGEGFVTSRVGAGTFVSEQAAGCPLDTGHTSGALRPRRVWDSVPVSTMFATPARFDFRTGMPDTARFPYETWRRLLGRELRASGSAGQPYGDPAGHEGLREAIVRHLGVARSVSGRAEEVVVTNGTQQALDLVVRVLLEPGDRVAVEDPGYTPPWHLFRSLGLDVTGVPVDDEGLVVDALRPGTRLVYVTPSHQYPLGPAMSLPRRLALLDWAQRHDAAVVEDDYDSEFRYGGRPIEPLQTLDSSGRVIYVGSFSKTMLPTLRLGFLVLPAGLAPAVGAAKFVTDWHTPLPTQAALARFIDEGWFVRHLRKMRTVYQARHERVLDGLAGPLGKHLAAIPSAAGLHIGTLATDATPDEIAAVAERARAAGVAVQSLSRNSFEQPPRAGVMLGYGAIAEADIPDGLHHLQRAFELEG
jgi:GntR family transcriptional regulator / MocR family aminotransferase